MPKLKDKSPLSGTGLPSDLDEAVLLMCALSFGPLSKTDLTRALKQVGMTGADGSPITVQKAGDCLNRLARKAHASLWEGADLCTPEARIACFDMARRNGWLLRFAEALRQAVPAQMTTSTWEYKWGGRRFVSFAHACREAFVALEKNDQYELKRLAGVCSQDRETQSLTNVLLSICIDPFQPALIERLPAQYWGTVMQAAVRGHTIFLTLDHPVFPYLRAKILADRHCLDPSLLALSVNHLAERDILAGDFAGARALLDTFADLDASLVRGMLELLGGRVAEARQAFDLSLRNGGKSKTAQMGHLGTFPGVLHTLLLVQSEQAKDRQQARTWIDWFEKQRRLEAYAEAYRALGALLDFHEGRLIEKRDAVRLQYVENVPLAYVAICLVALMYRLYASLPRTQRKNTEELVLVVEELFSVCREHGAQWPVMQLARLMHRLDLRPPVETGPVEAFFTKTPARDLSGLWGVREVWETRVGALEQLLQEAESAPDAPATVAPLRLGWKLYEVQPEELVVVPVEQKRTKSGGWTKGREVPLHRLINHQAEGLDYLTDQDQAALAGAQKNGRYYYDYAYRLDPGRALEALVGHPNVFWEDRCHVPVEIVRGTPEVHIAPRKGQLCIGMDPFPPPDFEGRLRATRIIKETPTRLRVIVFEPLHMKMAEILGSEGLAVPESRSNDALARLQGLSRHVAIQSNVALAGTDVETVEPDCRPRLRLQRLEQGLQAEMVVVPLGEQSQRAFTPGLGNAHLIESVAGKTLGTQRRLKEEAEQADKAIETVTMLEDAQNQDYTWVFDDPQEALELLEQLQAVPPEVLTVEWPKGDPITVRSLSAQQFRLSIRSAEDWFEVEGEVQVDQVLLVKMRTLLDQIENTDSQFIALGKDQYVALSRQLRKQLQWLATSAHFSGKSDTLRMHPLAAIGLEQWKDELGEFQTDATFDAHLERLRAIEKYEPAIPSTLQATLRPYQVDGFTWLTRLAEWGVGACLADDMGLGKTIEALALILHRASQGPTLVAAPTSVCANWVSEAQRFAPTLRPVRFGINDLGRRDDVLKALGPFDLAICSYTLLQQEVDALKDVPFATIVLDEAQAIKNAATKRSSAAMSLQGGFRMICTGTPIENRLAELWNLFRFINPGLLGSEERFHERFVRPIEVERDQHASHILKSLVQPFILRRTKSQVLEDLPPRTETMRLVELSPEERALHESLRQRALERLEGVRDMAPGQAHIQVLAELMKLRRCCCNPRLVMPDCGLTGSKLEAFAELVDELRENQHKALVFSQFVDHLTLLREHLDKQGIRYQYLDGSTPPKTRQKRIDAFQNGDGDLFLISLKAGGLGLNLTAADYVIHMDPWWNPAVEDQASDRAHRIGQTRPVTIYRLVAADTIEEKIVQLHHAKRDLADSLLEGTDTAHTLTADELIDLLKNS
ncbi:MAG: DEAD/DEAH box helicase [Planctomycetes bacterium]|nr:DEAD/DEAH box helicase [Planctomycetota bacterium]